MPFDESLLEEEISGFDPSLLEEESPRPSLAPGFVSEPRIELPGGLMAASRRWEEEAFKPTVEPQSISARDVGLMEKLRTGPVGRAILGPTEAEKEAIAEGAMAGPVGGDIGVLNIPKTLLQFTSVPPPLAENIRAGTKPLIEFLPEEAAGIARGVQESALNLPIAPLPAGAGKAVLPIFGAEYLAGAPNAYEAYQQALAHGDKGTAAQIATEQVLGGALLGLGGAHEAGLRLPARKPPVLSREQLRAPAAPEASAPESAAPAVEPAKPAEPSPAAAPEAKSVSEALKDLPAVPEGKVRLYRGEGGAMPESSELGGEWYTTNPEKAAQFGPKLQYVDVTPEEAAAARQRAKDKGRGGDTVILTKESLSKTKPVPGEVAPKVHDLEAPVETAKPAPITEELNKLMSATRDELSKYPGTATGMAWDIGAKARTPEDVAALREFAEKNTARIEALKKEARESKDLAKLNEAMDLASRQPAEAYEFATGVKLDGTPKWEFIEAKRPGYKPPVPDAKYLEAKGIKAAEAKPAAPAPEPKPAAAAELNLTKPVPGVTETTSKVAGEPVSGPPDTPLEAGGETPVSATRQAGKPASKVLTQKEVDKLGTEYEKARSLYGDHNLETQRRFQKWFDALKARKDEMIRRGMAKSKPTTIEEPAPTPAAPEPRPAQALGIAPQGTEPNPKWTSATREDAGLGQQLTGPFGVPNPVATFKSAVSLAKHSAKVLGPKIKNAIEAVKELGQQEANAPRMTDYRRAVLGWSAKLQQSFGEAASAQRDIQKAVPDPVRREGITNWIEADGDANVLQQRAAQTKDERTRAGYEAALNLTPDEIAVAKDVKAAFDALGQRGQAHDVVSNFRDNYVTHIWDTGKGPAMGSSRTLKDRFRYNKARTFATFFEGEQAGYTAKTKDISKILPVYLHEMNSVIAARQLVAQMSKGMASDGRPLVVPRGVGVPVEGEKGAATLVFPDVSKVETGDYKTMIGQPALTNWKYLTRDIAGNPVMLKADLAIHPEAFARIKAVLGKSAIREWYQSKTSAAAEIPKLIVKGLDRANSETKRTMLGLLAPFHQVQEATHAVGHRVNPTFNIPKIDLVNDAAQMDAARHGLMLLPDRVSEGQFMEGFRTSGLVSRIPGIGKVADWYANYLFHEYIPGLKFKTYSAILDRNLKVYAKELASGSIKPEDVKALSGEQTNAAFGHLNYADLGRNPTIQHMMQLGLLAPDFLEARARFTGQGLKGATGAKVGREQILALATLAIAQAGLAYTSAKLTGGEWDKKRPFEFIKDNRRYTLRSVPEDISSLIRDTRVFTHSRLSPIVGKGALQYASGVDWRGRKVGALETTKELVKQPIPLTIKGFLGIGNSPLSSWEQLAGAVGLRISRYSAANDIFQMVNEWAKNNPDARIQAQAEQRERETFASKYEGLHQAISANDKSGFAAELEKLRKSMPLNAIIDYMRTYSERPFTGSATNEKQFLRSLSESDRALYWQAREQKKEELKKFYQMLP